MENGIPLKDLAERRSFLDPHGGKVTGSVKSALARAAIVDVARDRWNRYWVLDCWADRVSTESMVDRIAEHYAKWHPAQFGIDSTGQQTLFVDTVKPLLRLRGSKARVIGVPAPTHSGDKVYRIRTVLQPIISEHRLMVNENCVELLAELAAFPTGKTVDIVDALASCITMFPLVATTVEQEDAGDDLYAEHLRDCGLPEDLIAARIVEQE